jgi:hypothetical protein
MCLCRAPEKYITGAALDRAVLGTRKHNVSETKPVSVLR